MIILIAFSKNIYKLIKNIFECFEWTPRKKNMAAHSLVNFGKSLDCNRQWFNSWPDCINDVLTLDSIRQ